MVMVLPGRWISVGIIATVATSARSVAETGERCDAILHVGGGVARHGVQLRPRAMGEGVVDHEGRPLDTIGSALHVAPEVPR